MQHDVGGDVEFVAMMIAGTIHEQQDELPGILLGQCLQENLEALRVGRRHDQIDAGAVLWADGAIQIDVFANELIPFPYQIDLAMSGNAVMDLTRSGFRSM